MTCKAKIQQNEDIKDKIGEAKILLRLLLALDIQKKRGHGSQTTTITHAIANELQMKRLVAGCAS